jgi:hypothetical protein
MVARQHRLVICVLSRHVAKIPPKRTAILAIFGHDRSWKRNLQSVYATNADGRGFLIYRKSSWT